MISCLLSRLKNNRKINVISYIVLIVLLFLYIFSIPSFSGRTNFNLITYALMALCAVVVIFRYALYDRFIFDRKL